VGGSVRFGSLSLVRFLARQEMNSGKMVYNQYRHALIEFCNTL